jgi:hypothetical protein
MKKKAQKKSVAFQPFQDGQIWQMGESSVQIGHVGKTLVHYKHFSAQTKRPPIRLSNKLELEKFLQQNDAVLLRAAARLSTPAGVSSRLAPSRRLLAGLKERR